MLHVPHTALKWKKSFVDVGLNMSDACVGENRFVFGHLEPEVK